MKLDGEENDRTLGAAYNYVISLVNLDRFKEAKLLLRTTVPIARRVFGEGKELTLRMRSVYAQSLYRDDQATLDDLRKAVTTLEDVDRIARRVLGGAHPLVEAIEHHLRAARAALRARETPEKLAQDAFRTARAKLAQERAELAQTIDSHRRDN